MEDRELLEFTAKACGMPRPVDDNGVWSTWVGTLESGHWWNPLDDDGDALRIAIILKLDISIDDYAQVSWWKDQGVLDWVNDECCRRAIVRAAAEIGKAMR